MSGINFAHFVRSYRHALLTLFNENIKNFLGEDNKIKPSFNLKNFIEQETMKKKLKFKIGDLTFNMHYSPSENHIGNCFLEGVGTYNDIWPITTLMTDCDPEKNSILATRFLEFAKSTFVFTKDILVAINGKFADANFNGMIECYRKYLTGTAFLYTFLEPMRRMKVEKDLNKLDLVSTKTKVLFM